LEITESHADIFIALRKLNLTLNSIDG